MRLHSLVFLFCAASVAAFAQPVPVAGPNVNMVSGTTWPDGDPYLQRQNEGSIAVSSRNSAHLLAASNDYRTVDLVNDGTGDAWLGVFKSFDGGQTWKSTLLPGCPYNTPQCVTNPPSPISGLQAAADPTVRAGTNGMFYLSGLAANRGTNPLGAVFVARFIDNNNAEKTSADPIQYLDTMVIESGTSGRFVDKPWLAADIPRAGAAMCNVAGQQFPAGNVYLVYSVFTGSKSSKIMFTVSKDCGAHWNTPTKLSESNSVNQGTILAIDPATGNVYVAWRRFVVSNQPDAILIAKSTDFGQTFSKAVELPGMIPFDQGTTGVSFRTNAYPALAVSYDEAAKISRVHLAWSQRGVGPSGDARIVMSTSRDGKTWPAPVAVDSPAAPRFPNLSARGHQIMPAMTFAAGRLMIVYYDASEDSTVGELVCQGCDTVAARTEVRNLAGNLAAGSPGSVFNSAIADQAPAGLPPLIRRHTLDVRVAEALPADTPVFVSTRVSQYLFGSSSGGSLGSKPILQIKSFPPDLPLFSQGTLPFIGDYLDLTAQNFVPGPDGKSWQFNTNPANQPVFHAVWTDNRDVQPPPDGDWTKYTPPGPNCIPGRAGMRNQNIYTSRITEGLAVSVVGNAKKLNASTPATFVVTVQNNTNRTTTYQLTITPPAGVTASFQKPPAPVTLSLIVMVAPRSSASRPVFATSTVGTIPIAVKVVETTPPANQAPQQSSVSLNPDTYAPANFDLTNGELYNVGLVNFDLTNVPVTNFDLTNIDLKNFDLTNFDLTNFDLTNIGTPNFDLTNADVANFDLTNSAIKNFDLTNSALTDVTWKITNTGNTTTSYNTKLLLKDQIPAGFKLQLVLYKVYKTPTAGGAGRCSVGEQPQRVVVASIPNPTFGSPSDPNLGVPDLTTSDVTNATLPLAPGEEGRITLRILGNAASATNLATNSVKTVVVAHPGAIALVITQTQTLPDAISGSPYSATLQALGGTAPLTWTLLSGSLPQGLQLSSGGVISGTPGGSGQSTFTVQVADASSQKDTQTLSLTVLDKTAPVITASAAPYVSGTWTNQNVLVTFTCTDNPGGSGVASLTPPVTVSTEGANQSVAGTCTDNAGNSASATFSGINIDKTAPVIAITTPANGASFARNAVVNASFACTDAASGIATCSGTVANGAGIDTSTLGAKTFLVAATDKAGNPATLSYSYTVIDVTAPVITASAGAYVSGTWTNQNVVVTFACTDEPGGSGVASVTPPVTVSTQGANQSVTGTCTDNAGNSASATFSGINIDKTAPVITITTPASGAGYALNAVVNASFACTDTGSGVATCSGTVANGAAIDTGALGQKTFTVNASDNAGNTATLSYTYTVIDVTAPVITASAGAYVSGTWTNQHVVVTFACTDEPGGSGVASVTPPVTVSTQGANQSVTGTCTDTAGNSASATFSGINIDKTAPVITITTPASGASFALNALVNASFACTDAASGVATCSGTVANGAAIDTGALGQKTFTVNSSDNAGNTATLSYTYTVIDVTAPVITASAGAYVSGTWTNQNVVVTFACTDEPGGSGVASVTSPVTVSTEGEGQSATGTCTDKAGNSSSATFSGINIDKTAPVITITAPANGATLYLNATVAAAYACTDARAGVASCSGTVANGANIDTATAGSKTFTVNATDKAGNTAQLTVSYTVVIPYTFVGFFSPLGPAGTFAGEFNRGSNISIKWQLIGPGEVPLTDLGLIQALQVAPNASCSGAPTGTPVLLYPSATGATILRVSGQYIFNWDTSGFPNGCYNIVLKLSNGTTPTTIVGLN